MQIQHVFFLTIMKLSLISYFSVAWQRLFGVLLPIALELTMFLEALISVGHGVRNDWLMVNSFMLLVSLLFVGQYGKCEIALLVVISLARPNGQVGP